MCVIIMLYFVKDSRTKVDWNGNNHCAGKSQSPIDIKTAKALTDKSLSMIKFEGYDSTSGVKMKLQNNGYTVKLSWSAESMKISGGGLPDVYVAAQLHFHWGSDKSKGSEHTIDGKACPMEIHIVHYKKSFLSLESAVEKPQGLAVIGFFYEETSEDNKNYVSLVNNLVNVRNPGNTTDFTAVTLDSLLTPTRNQFYRYDGSLTTPGCFESVIWTVFTNTIQISSSQMKAFRSLLSAQDKTNDTPHPLNNNFRSVQKLNNRKVKKFETVAKLVNRCEILAGNKHLRLICCTWWILNISWSMFR